MKKSFTIQRTAESDEDPSTLLPILMEETGSEDEAASVLRSIQRMGGDDSVLFYEMTLETRTSRAGGLSSNAWRVRADRGLPRKEALDEETPPPE